MMDAHLAWHLFRAAQRCRSIIDEAQGDSETNDSIMSDLLLRTRASLGEIESHSRSIYERYASTPTKDA